GDDAGNVYGCFAARDPATPNRDKHRFVRAHALEPQGGAIVDIGPSERERTLVTADAAGGLVVRNMTSHAVVARIDASGIGALREVSLLPKIDGVLAISDDGRYLVTRMNPGHPDATWFSLFGRVWYEGESRPGHVYQSSSGDDAAEAKYGLVPLIWGTLKATIYTMIFAAPIAILAAVFTSEFLGARVRSAIKPTIETMASLPSVVLGFIAAMVVAPAAAAYLPGVLLAFIALPVGVLFAAHLWQFASQRVLSRANALTRLVMIAVVTLVSGWAAIQTGPVAESLLFRAGEKDLLVQGGAYEVVPESERPAWVGARELLTASETLQLRREGFWFVDAQVVRPSGSLEDPDVWENVVQKGLDRPSMRSWLNGVYGSAWPGWFVLAFPGAMIIVVLFINRRFDARVREWAEKRTPVWSPVAELARFLGAIVASVLAATAAATVLTGLGFDPRESIFGSFSQRNTLIVALAMSVAVIPIIYTICDDAMTSVPDALRSASLAAGATKWQTAVRIVLPVAMSGIFSACMIGLGRAAGETMIVLMATGNTPIMSMSVFDGMRTLSANIAVELPEAPKDETHYRVLFLCGLVLFVITFAVNTVAELVRQRFRKRSAAL
ncbi:MAG: ABC transporter permease subunit, partial [Phycisphaerales bacterium]